MQQGKTGGKGQLISLKPFGTIDSMMGVISGLSEAEIVAQIDSMGAGLGHYNASEFRDSEHGGSTMLATERRRRRCVLHRRTDCLRLHHRTIHRTDRCLNELERSSAQCIHVDDR